MEIRYPAVLELVRFVDLEKAAAALGKGWCWRWSDAGQGRSIGSDPVEIPPVPSFSPAGDPFGQEARPG